MSTPPQKPRRLDHPACVDILAWLFDAGGASRFVGGCVRDHLLNRDFFDIDIATPLHPETVMELMSSKGVKVIPTGLKHGTVTLVHQGEVFEVTTLRKDVESDGRHAIVAFSEDWIEDAARRDFTMNAISMDLEGTLYDPFDGEKDCKTGIVKFVGDPRKRIEEDYLRLLRFFRFNAHYGKQSPDPEVLAICREMKNGLDQLSSERIRDEWMKLLSALNPIKWIKLMISYEIIDHVLPCSVNLEGFDLLCAYEDKPDALRRLAHLVFEASDIQNVGRKLKLSKAQQKQLSHICQSLKGITTLQDLNLTRGQLYEFGPDSVEHAFYLFCAKNGFHGLSPSQNPHFQEIEKWRNDPAEFPLQGRDLVPLGLSEGPQMGLVLKNVLEWWKDRGCYDDYESCLNYARSII